MASGQERILRRRIRSINSTKKITRAMELIAGEPDRPRAGAGRTRRRPTPTRSRRSCSDLAVRGRRLRQPVARSSARESGEVAYIVIAADRGLCGAYNSAIFRATEGLDPRARGSWVTTTSSSSWAARPRATSVTATTASCRAHRVLRPADATRTARAIAHTVEGPFLAGDVDLVQTRLHPVRVGRVPGSRDPAAHAARPETFEAHEPKVPASRLRVRAEPVGDSRRGCCRATPRPACTPRC